ncbi:universal stress protein [Desulfoprunum benzoelyticum]|uniref:Nucleotide-binding universal stress UspA family protein n=1 Tax=Desulfoprunum benzoelyticum TaxID=1506996 RepID=A0A840USI5_9BACT|nr:universal stress protein [Desulfoprunum benzoelyticum]MBB5346334.1 nucleotide-binding universal stress UspA family protein [Desulfoprunum benzoelyticum]MBM9528667.1 universal stress protein [Desulfoprunum benzoelyticum]
MEKKLLLAVDGSTFSAQALDYVAALFTDRHDVNFHVLHCTNVGCPVLPEAEDPANSLLPSNGRFDRNHAAGLRHLKKAEDRLTSLGIPADRITSSTVPHSTSIAASLKGYAEKHLVDSIVVARRGIGVVGEMLLGSVSAELFRKCRKIPLWIIDGEVKNNRFFVPVDGSVNSLMAVDHLAHIFAGRNDVAFLFFHARGLLSSRIQCVPEDFYSRWGKEWCDTHLQGKNCLFTGPIQLLIDAGIDKEMIHTLPEPTTLEESTSIISHAKIHGCGTIVIGRRQEGTAKGVLGSISSRTVMQTQNMALWIIG